MRRPEIGRLRDGGQRSASSQVVASRNTSRNRGVALVFRDGFRDDVAVAHSNAVRIGYARVSGRSQDHQLQLDALDQADCREVIVETASTRSDRPKLRQTLERLQAGDTLVIYKPDRVARSMKELLVLLEDELHAREINLEILSGMCAGLHKPTGATIADKMLFLVAAMAAEMERDLIHERTMDELAAAAAQGRTGGRPATVDADTLAVARARKTRGESVTSIAAHLGVGRSTLYRALGSENQTSTAKEGTNAATTIRAPARTAAETTTAPQREVPQQPADSRARLACPTCGHEPRTRPEALQQREDLAIVWLRREARDGSISQHHHCAQCQPHSDCVSIECASCGDGPIVSGTLADRLHTPAPYEPPALLRTWLTNHGWQLDPEPLCPAHQQ